MITIEPFDDDKCDVSGEFFIEPCRILTLGRICRIIRCLRFRHNKLLINLWSQTSIYYGNHSAICR